MSSGCLRNMGFFLSKSCLSITQVTKFSRDNPGTWCDSWCGLLCRARSWTSMILKGLFQLRIFYDYMILFHEV